MARKKGRETRSVTFRMPVEHYEALAAAAHGRGIDVSALLNVVIADALPVLRARIDHDRTPTPYPCASSHHGCRGTTAKPGTFCDDCEADF